MLRQGLLPLPLLLSLLLPLLLLFILKPLLLLLLLPLLLPLLLLLLLLLLLPLLPSPLPLLPSLYLPPSPLLPQRVGLERIRCDDDDVCTIIGDNDDISTIVGGVGVGAGTEGQAVRWCNIIPWLCWFCWLL